MMAKYNRTRNTENYNNNNRNGEGGENGGQSENGGDRTGERRPGSLQEAADGLLAAAGARAGGQLCHMQPAFETSNGEAVTADKATLARKEQENVRGGGAASLAHRQLLSPAEGGQASPRMNEKKTHQGGQTDCGLQPAVNARWPLGRRGASEKEFAGRLGPAGDGPGGAGQHGAEPPRRQEQDEERQLGLPGPPRSFTREEAAPQIPVGPPSMAPATSSLSPPRPAQEDCGPYQQLSFQIRARLHQQTFEAEVSPLLRALSPGQQQQLEEKLDLSEQKLGQFLHDVHGDQLLIGSSSQNKEAEKSTTSRAEARQGCPDDRPAVSQFDVEAVTAAQQHDATATTGRQAVCGGATLARPDLALINELHNMEMHANKSELTVIKSESEFNSSKPVADLKKHLEERESSQQQVESKVDSKNCDQGSEKLEDGVQAKNRKPLKAQKRLSPQLIQAAMSQRTEQYQRDERARSSDIEVHGSNLPNRASMTQIVDRDCLKNIREDEGADDVLRRSQEDFQNLQQIDDGQIKFEESGAAYAVWEFNGRLPKRTGAEQQLAHPGPIVHTMRTPTASAGAEAIDSSLQQRRQTFVFPENSQSCSSRPLYYHESVIERSHDVDCDDGRTVQMYAIPSYSALDKSQSHTHTDSISRSIDHSTKQRRTAAELSQQRTQLQPTSLNASSRHSRAETEGFALLLSSEHSIQQMKQAEGAQEVPEHLDQRQELLQDHVKSIAFEEVADRAREAKEVKSGTFGAVVGCSGSKEAMAAGATANNINEFLTFAQKICRSSHGKEQAMDNQQRFAPKMLMELSEGEAASLPAPEQEIQMMNTLGQFTGAAVAEQRVAAAESDRDGGRNPTGSTKLSARQQPMELVNNDGLLEAGRTAELRNQKSSSQVNSMYLNNANASHSIQSSQKLIEAASSSRSAAKRAEEQSSQAALPQCTANDAPGEPTWTESRPNEVCNSWHTFNQNCAKQKAQQSQAEESKSYSAVAQMHEEQLLNFVEATARQVLQGPAEKNQDLANSPTRERPSDQAPYEASCSRNLKHSAHSLYSDEETALKNHWEQHQRNQQQRLRRQRNHNLANKVGFRTTKDRGPGEEAQRSRATSKTKSRNADRVEKDPQAKSTSSNVRAFGDALRTADVSLETSAQWSHQHTVGARNMAAFNCTHVSKSYSCFALNGGLVRDRSQISRQSDAEDSQAQQTADANHTVFERNQKWKSQVQQKQRMLKQMIESQAVSKELEECRFKPQVIGFAYDNSGLNNKEKTFYKCDSRQRAVKQGKPVHQRCQDWQESRQSKLVRREAQLKNREVKECTFKPKIVEYQPKIGGKMESQPEDLNRMAEEEGKLKHQGSKSFIQRQTEWAANLNHKKGKQRSTLEKQQASEQTFKPKISQASQKIWWRRVVSTHLAQEQQRKTAMPHDELNVNLNKLVGMQPSEQAVGPPSEPNGGLRSDGCADARQVPQRSRCKSTGTLPRRPRAGPPPSFQSHAGTCSTECPRVIAAPSESQMYSFKRLRSLSNSNRLACQQYCPDSSGGPGWDEQYEALEVSQPPASQLHGGDLCQLEDSACLPPANGSGAQDDAYMPHWIDGVQAGAQQLFFQSETAGCHLIYQQIGDGGGHLEATEGVHARLQSVQPSHLPLLQGVGRPVPGRIYKQMTHGQHQPQQQSMALDPHGEASASKPAYFTEASKQISEAIAHLQRINQRHKASAEWSYSEEEDLASQAFTPPVHQEQLHHDAVPPMCSSEPEPSSCQPIRRSSRRERKLLRLTRARQDQAPADLDPCSREEYLHLVDDFQGEDPSPPAMPPGSGGQLGQIMEQKQELIRNLKDKQRRQGVMIQKGLSNGSTLAP